MGAGTRIGTRTRAGRQTRVGVRNRIGVRSRGGLRGDRGAASVWTAFAACALCVVFGAVLALGQAMAARHRAGGAADLAALAAADRALWGEAEACAAASRVAAAQGAELLGCAVRGEVAEVTARVVRGPYRPEVRSRAGPQGPQGPPGAPPRPAGSSTAGPAGPPSGVP
ncbi:Rv3654c family TadE-like protein [Streptomyces sp. NPDC017254]|uniref:Rv3654c family TadE-like protein n=1 Tax=unclassified Streptomyces TaxID=2593676 RepID=UPI00379F4C35